MGFSERTSPPQPLPSARSAATSVTAACRGRSHVAGGPQPRALVLRGGAQLTQRERTQRSAAPLTAHGHPALLRALSLPGPTETRAPSVGGKAPGDAGIAESRWRQPGGQAGVFRGGSCDANARCHGQRLNSDKTCFSEESPERWGTPESSQSTRFRERAPVLGATGARGRFS